MDVIEKLPNEDQTILSLALQLTSCGAKVRVFPLLATLENQLQLAETISCKNCLLHVLQKLKEPVAAQNKTSNDIGIFNLCKNIPSYYKVNLLSKFASDEAKVELLSTVEDNYIIEGLLMIKESHFRAMAAKNLKYDNYKCEALNYLIDEQDKFDIAQLISFDNYLFKSVQILKNEKNIVDIALKINSDNYKCDVLNYVTKIENKWAIIRTFKNMTIMKNVIDKLNLFEISV